MYVYWHDVIFFIKLVLRDLCLILQKHHLEWQNLTSHSMTRKAVPSSRKADVSNVEFLDVIVLSQREIQNWLAVALSVLNTFLTCYRFLTWLFPLGGIAGTDIFYAWSSIKRRVGTLSGLWFPALSITCLSEDYRFVVRLVWQENADSFQMFHQDL